MTKTPRILQNATVTKAVTANGAEWAEMELIRAGDRGSRIAVLAGKTSGFSGAPAGIRTWDLSLRKRARIALATRKNKGQSHVVKAAVTEGVTRQRKYARSL